MFVYSLTKFSKIFILHLSAHDGIFIAVSVIRAAVMRIREETDQLVLIQVHVADIAFIILIVAVVGTAFTAILHK